VLENACFCLLSSKWDSPCSGHSSSLLYLSLDWPVGVPLNIPFNRRKCCGLNGFGPFCKWNLRFRTYLYSDSDIWGPPLWSSGQSCWLQIQRSGFDSRRYQIFWVVAGLERGPLSLVITNEELLGRKSSGCGLESREYRRRDPSIWPCDSIYPQKLALNWPTSVGRSVGIVR
jgi:hypothetical protein